MSLTAACRMLWYRAVNRAGQDRQRKRTLYRLKYGGIAEPPAFVGKKAAISVRMIHGQPVWILRPHGTRTERAILYLPNCPLTGPRKPQLRFALNTARGNHAEVWLAFSPADSGSDYLQALGWSEQVYSELRKAYHTGMITVMGEGWGCSLAVGLMQRTSRRPARLILLSPAAGQEEGLSREVQLSAARLDPLMTREAVDAVNTGWAGRLPADSPFYDPCHADCSGFPPVLLIHGRRELFYPHVETLRHRLVESGVQLRTLSKPLWPGWMLARIPESLRAAREIRAWIAGRIATPEASSGT